jgi:hypothetical protein
LGIGLRRHLAGGFAIGADAGLVALAMLLVAQIPDAAAEVGADTSDAERGGLLGWLTRALGSRHFGLSSEKLSATKRYKKRYKRELPGVAQKRKCL